VVTLTSQETALRATLGAIARTSQMTLLDFMR